MDIEQFIGKLAALDVKVWLDGDKLRLNAPDGVVTPELRAELAARKADIVAFLSQAASAPSKGIAPADRTARIPLTLGQERIWSLAKIDPSSSVYNVPTVFRVQGRLDPRVLEQALVQVLQRHEALRTVFPGTELADARQEVQPPGPVVVPVTNIARDVGNLPKEQASAAIMRVVESEVRAPFDLSAGPLWRVRLFVLAPTAFVLAFTMHHSVFDGMSKSIFLDELGRAYAAVAAGGTFDAGPPSVQFSDIAV